MPGNRQRSSTPGIYRLKSGLWQAILRVHGRQRSRSFPTKAQAVEWRRTTLVEAARGSYIDPAGGKFLLWEWVELWEETRRVAATTAATTRSRLNAHILPAFGTRPLARITPQDIKTWVRKLEDQGLSRSTVAGVYALMAQIMDEAVEADLIGRSPCRRVKFDPTRPGGREARVLTTAEAARLLEALRPTGRTLVLVTLGTGMRWGEVTGLRRRNIQLLGRPPHLEVIESLHEADSRLWWGPPKTRSSKRRIPLPGMVARALAAHLPPNGDPEDVVFTSPQGMPWRRRNFGTRVWLPALRRIYEETNEEVDLRGLHFHELRHTYSSWLADAGIPEVIRAAVMGHKVGFTQTSGYTQVISGFEGRVLAVLEERLSVADVGFGTG